MNLFDNLIKTLWMEGLNQSFKNRSQSLCFSFFFFFSSLLGVGSGGERRGGSVVRRGISDLLALQSPGSCVKPSLTIVVSADLSSLISELTGHLLKDQALNPKSTLSQASMLSVNSILHFSKPS